MKDMFEEEIKIKINNYMEQIKVPKNLGGIVMEDFEKIKKEESQNITKENIEKTNIQEGEKPKNKTGKLFKISLGSVAAVVLVGVGIIAGTKIVGDKVITIDKNGGQSGSIFVGDNKVKLISTDHLSEYLGDWYSDDASLRIKSFDNDQIKFDIGLYRTAAMDDAIGTLQDKTNAKFTWKFEEKVEVSGLMEFKDDSIIVTFTSSNDKNIPLNYKITFKRENKKLENEENLNNQNDKQTKISLTEEEKHQLQVFLNKPENNPWTLLTYKEPKDVLSHTHNIGLDHEVDAAEILRYSIKFGGYGRGQANIYGTEPGFVSTQEDMNRFFKEKLFESNFTEEEIQKAFKNDYNKNVSGKYTFWVSDSCFTPAIIENCYKTSENIYFVKLDHGQNIELRKDAKENYLFYSCTGFDGKIGNVSETNTSNSTN